MKLIMENWKRFLKEGTGTGLTAHRSGVMAGPRKGFINALKQALSPDQNLGGDPIELWAKAGEFKAHPARGEEEIGVNYTITKGDLNFIVNELGSFAEENEMKNEFAPVINKLRDLALEKEDKPAAGANFAPMDDSLRNEYFTIGNMARGEITMADEPSSETASRIGKQTRWSPEDLLAKMRSLK